MSAQELRGKYVLEAGCGAGRSTEVLLRHGAMVCALDASSAVYANARSNRSDRATFLQASIYDIPVAPGFFDIVLCLGLLQHTPDRARSVRCLADQVKPGGFLCVDSYPWFWHQRLALRYLVFRPLVSRLPAKWIRAISSACVRTWWPFRRLLRVDLLRRALSLVFPANVPYYYNVSRNKSDEFLKQWALLDTHDFLSPRYDTADSLVGLASKFRAAGLEEIQTLDMRDVRTADGRVVSGFFVGRARKPAVAAPAGDAAVLR